MNNDLCALVAWATQWLVTINANKTEYLIISRKRHKTSPVYPALSLGGKSLRQVDNYKQLGVIFNDTLTWDQQIGHLNRKTLRSVVMLKNALDNT